MKVIDGILITRICVNYSTEIIECDSTWEDFGINLELVECFYSVNSEKFQDKTKIVTSSEIEYIIDMSFKEFTEIYLKYRQEGIFLYKSN